MRAPMQVLVIPYTIKYNSPLFCVLRRSDEGWWQFIAGGGEDDETPLQAARREAFEEIGIDSDSHFYLLQFKSYVPSNCISEDHRKNWPTDTYILPEYYFSVNVKSEEIILSFEHTEYRWVSFEEAKKLLNWQSNMVAMHELNERIINKDEI